MALNKIAHARTVTTASERSIDGVAYDLELQLVDGIVLAESSSAFGSRDRLT